MLQTLFLAVYFLLKEGIYSHFANSDQKDHEMNNLQLDRFNTITKNQSIIKHVANSNAIDNIENCHHDLIRIGFNAYLDSFTIKVQIRHIQFIQKGESIGYGSTYCDEDSTIAVIGIGYADGIPSQLSNKGHVIIEGTKCNIIGKICMDMFMVKCPKNIQPKIGSEATIISNSDSRAMTIEEISTLTNLNPREIMTHFSQRIERTYLN